MALARTLVIPMFRESGRIERTLSALADAGVFDLIGESSVVPEIDDALAVAYEALAPAARSA